MPDFDWSRFTLKIYLNAPVQRVYDAWTTRNNIESWFLRKGEFRNASGTAKPNDDAVKVGDTYEWMWYGYPDSVAEHGEITEANGKDRFQFVFGKAGIVTVQLADRDGTTEMLLTQHQVPDDDAGAARYHVGCSTGWTFYMANMKSILEGGIDLRNKNPELTNVINA